MRVYPVVVPVPPAVIVPRLTRYETKYAGSVVVRAGERLRATDLTMPSDNVAFQLTLPVADVEPTTAFESPMAVAVYCEEPPPEPYRPTWKPGVVRPPAVPATPRVLALLSATPEVGYWPEARLVPIGKLSAAMVAAEEVDENAAKTRIGGKTSVVLIIKLSVEIRLA